MSRAQPTIEASAPVRPSTGIDGALASLALLFALALAHAAYHLLAGLDHAILDFFGFRQAQTAISAFWMEREGLKLAYPTPVLGSPWEIPFEFPLYQWLVALVAELGVSVDAAGRLVSFAFLVGALAPLWLLLRTLGYGLPAFLLTGSLLLGSPLYAFYGRTVMIETTAVFLGLLWVALLARLALRPNGAVLAATVGVGALAALVKITTFPGFAVLGGAITLAAAWRSYRSEGARPARTVLFVAATAVILPVIIGYAWVLFTDEVKSRGALGGLLTSSALAQWNYGSLAQRLDLAFWRDVVLFRTMPDTFGYGSVLVPFVISAGLMIPRVRWPILVCLAAFAVPLLLFTNLHLVHSYYQLANALFALAAVGFALSGLAQAVRPGLAVALILALLAGQLGYFAVHYKPTVLTDTRVVPKYRIAAAAKAGTAEGSGLLVLGDDWSSEIPYYSERKSIALSTWFPDDLSRRILADPEPFMGGLSLGGVVLCGSADAYGALAPDIDALIARQQASAVQEGNCRFWAAAE